MKNEEIKLENVENLDDNENPHMSAELENAKDITQKYDSDNTKAEDRENQQPETGKSIKSEQFPVENMEKPGPRDNPQDDIETLAP